MLIEINLAPGASGGRSAGGRLSGMKLPAMPSFGSDVRAIGAIVGGILIVGAIGFGYWRMGARIESLQVEIEREVTDSTRFAAAIELLQTLRARQDTIARKIDVIREVDARRYVWPHLLDEISLAVPAFTWISAIGSSESDDASIGAGPVVTIQGNAGSTQALTRFMKNLEASPFLGDVTLITTEQEDLDGRLVQRFSLEARYREPAPGFVQTFPLVVLE